MRLLAGPGNGVQSIASLLVCPVRGRLVCFSGSFPCLVGPAQFSALIFSEFTESVFHCSQGISYARISKEHLRRHFSVHNIINSGLSTHLIVLNFSYKPNYIDSLQVASWGCVFTPLGPSQLPFLTALSFLAPNIRCVLNLPAVRLFCKCLNRSSAWLEHPCWYLAWMSAPLLTGPSFH